LRQRPGIGSNRRQPCPTLCWGASRKDGPLLSTSNDMTDGEIAYLSMVMILFLSFIIVIGTLTTTQKKRED
jgi:hypothetical protein